MKLIPDGFSAHDLVSKHRPTVLKRHITEYSLSDNDWKGHDSIRVVCRFRPPNKREVAYSRTKKVPNLPPEWESDQTVRLKRPRNEKSQSKSSTKPFKCTLDSILQPKTTQKQVFYLVGQPMILSCLEGFNSTIFAYGQSGSGKTYTMFGPENDTSNVEQFGLIPRCFIYLFQKLNTQLSNHGGDLQDFKVNMELLQIYKRDLLDLLNPNSKAKLVIKTDFRTDSIFVQNLRSVEVNSVEEAFACLTEAQSNRIVAGHALNSVSSRSHMLVIVNIVQRRIDGSVKRSKLNFGDLAGSEDLTKALGKNPDPIRRQEAIAINSSLSALTTAMSFLSKGKKPGYRDSPLTHVLKDSLGGNSKTTLFLACSPHIYNRNETIRALRFAQTAKKVKNKAKKNEEQSVSSLKKRIKELELQVASLQAQLVEARGKQSVFKKAISKMALLDDGLGNRSLSLRIHPTLNSNKKPGPVPYNNNRSNPYSQNSPVNLPATIAEEAVPFNNNRSNPAVVLPSKIEKVVSPIPENASPMSFTNSPIPDNMIKVSASMDFDQCEWSGSDRDEKDVLFSDGEEELAVDELLREDGGEEELNYIHEISELRRQLQDAMSSNNILNEEITSKNIELEHCSNQIAQLVEEVEQAHTERNQGRRQSSVEDDDVTTLEVDTPTYEEDSLELSDEHSPLPPIPNIRSASQGIITTPEIMNTAPFHAERQGSVMEGYEKSDSGFSFAADGNNTMLKYLMELQQNIQNAKQDFQELKVAQESTRRIYYGDSEDSESTEESDQERKEKINLALKENLSKTKDKSCNSFFKCFAVDTEDAQEEMTSILVEEYLKEHVRAEMKKQIRKKKKKRKKVSREMIKRESSYNFDNEELSVLTVSPTHTADDVEHLSFTYEPSPLLNIQEDAQPQYRVHVDSLGDSRRDILTTKKTKPRQRN